MILYFFSELCRRIETVPNNEKVQETRNPNSVQHRPPSMKDQKVKENNSTNNQTDTFLREIGKEHSLKNFLKISLKFL